MKAPESGPKTFSTLVYVMPILLVNFSKGFVQTIVTVLAGCQGNQFNNLGSDRRYRALLSVIT